MIPAHWADFKAKGLEKDLLLRANQEPYGLFGINIYNTDEADPRIFDYLIAVSSDTEAGMCIVVFMKYRLVTWANLPLYP